MTGLIRVSLGVESKWGVTKRSTFPEHEVTRMDKSPGENRNGGAMAPDFIILPNMRFRGTL